MLTNHRPRIFAALVTVLLAFPLSGCGGGASLPTDTTPVIDSFTVNGVTVAFSGTSVPVVQVPTNSLSTLVCTAHDPNLGPLTFAWTGPNGTVTTQNNVSTAGDTPLTDGDSLVTCTVTGVRGTSATRTITLRAVTGTTGLALALTAASGTVSPGKTDILSAVVTNDSNPITYHFTIVAGTGTVSQSTTVPAQATFTAPNSPEQDTVLCFARDTQGRSATASTIITVQ